MSKIPLPTPLSFFLLLIAFIPSLVISQADSTEQAILLNLKQQLENPPALQEWNSSSTSACDWRGIQCTKGTVTGIILPDINITVPIPATICDLKNLTLLQLAWNYIPGKFPDLYNCSKLQYLNISQNCFIGTIPDDIDKLSSLQLLDIAGNNFTGDIPPAIGNLTELKTLYMYGNRFNGTFPNEIGNLSNLEELMMGTNSLFVPKNLPSEFGKLTKLTLLSIRGANLVGEIPESLSNLLNLEYLDLATNHLEGVIPKGLFSLKNLSFVYLFYNNLSGQIPQVVESRNLTEIDLSRNNLNGSIPDDFGELHNLQILYLYENQLSGGIPASIGLIPTLGVLRIFTNKLSGVLPPEIGLHSNLVEFDVSGNQFSGNLPENLCSRGVLRGLVAFSNNLTGEIPKSLGDCTTLLTVQLHKNNFSGEIPPGIWMTPAMMYLLLSENSFSGQLPSKIAWNLSRVEINNNRFSGPIPRSISSWGGLIVFEASNNLFSGEIPVELTSLSKLDNLLLDGNQLSGRLPSQIVSWKSLSSLNLARNNLSGEIPSAMGSLLNLLYLDLSQNHLSGEIPPALGRLRLPSLNLSSNQLSGRIPEEFDNLAYGSAFMNNPNLCTSRSAINLPNCYVKSRDSKNLSSKLLAVILVLAIGVLLITTICTLFVIRDCLRKKENHTLTTWKLTSFQRLDFTEAKILGSLTENNLIGSGGSGKVYRIVINREGGFVAVKRIWNDRKPDHKLEKQFVSELKILGSVRHSNIVKLLCCISSEDSKLLVYEYMENHSLDRWLHGDRRRSSSGMSSVHHFVLDWPRRMQIAIGTAQGLYYMHHECSPAIVHRDVKASNILLDSEFNARIADFGLARLLAKQGDQHTVSTVAGSFGYIAPEYAYKTKANEKIDVYSFGVVLLELATGREAVEGDETSNLAEWAWRQNLEGRPIVDCLDRDITEEHYVEEMSTVFKLGMMCTNTLPSSRPSMKDVLQVLRRCANGNGEKKINNGRDVAPLLGTETYLSSYRTSGGVPSDDGPLLYSV